ncbi:dihydropteroate synthase [Pseudomonadales bacterium]|nr:dihydropteroate synthase [Pseudomonadales bacterium]
MQPIKRPMVMGILNVTPDSFADGGKYLVPAQAAEHARQMILDGADIIDVGGESTRPGAAVISVEEELHRVIPVIQAIRAESTIPISIDTSTPEVMRQAALMGVDLINDVRALSRPGALAAAAATGLPVCLTHMQGDPQTMQLEPTYTNLLVEICGFFEARILACEAAGIPRAKIILDPGFGFGKTAAHNLQLINRLEEFMMFGCPLLVGLSRKSTIGEVLGDPAVDRLQGSIAGALLAYMNGASLLRVHDVAETVQALRVVKAIQSEGLSDH